MNKILKIFMCSIVSLILVMGMSIQVFAANPSTGSTITIDKNLKVTNPTLTSVDGPGLSYSYTLASETPSNTNGGTTISDGTHTANVYAGPTGGVTLSTDTVSWPKGTAVNASAAGADNIKSITATADVTKFDSPGIYRYKITEAATPTNPATIGVTDANPAEVRYIDVYVENGNTGLEIAGVVMHDGTTPLTTANKKTFDASQFDTKNIEVHKIVTGNMANKNHEFAFSATVTDNGRYYYDGEGNTASAATNQNSTGSSSATLKDGECFWICGVSTIGTVNVTETNNTTDTYTTSISGAVTVGADTVSPQGTVESGNITMSDNRTLTFTNTLESVSPTGVIMRFGPFVLLALLAAVLVVFNRRVKVEK